ncbi:MAG TPA: hypothetical protein VFG14_09930 [Chthoniobacteraceae bacterium]|nr:hypothetical protein [Chthoniobacteraceae bacterium]
MRTLSLALAVAALPSLALAENDTAYKALRIFGKKLGDAQLNRVVEVRGRAGMPQPQVWKITASDTSARGGLVEADIQRGKIISQRTPTSKGSAGAPLDLNKLNLDSDGAFTVANQEMEKGNVPFDRIDFVLRSSSQGRAPVWHLDLYDGSRGKIASFDISADTGTLLEQSVGQPRGTDPYADDRAYVGGGSQPPSGRDREYSGSGEHSQSGQPFRGVGDFFNRLGRRMERRGTELKRFFGGD